MTDYPFRSAEATNHRFHGVISGRLTLKQDRLNLITSWGEIQLFYPRFQGRAFFAARRNWENNPDQLLHVYGYPKTNQHGQIVSMQMVSFHRDGDEPKADQNELPFSYRFQSGQFWLCGRVRSIEKDGTTVIKVTQKVAVEKQKPWYWFVTGRSIERPIKGSKTLFVGFHDDRGRLVLKPQRLIKHPRPSNRPSAVTPPVVRRSSRRVSAAASSDQCRGSIPKAG